MKLELFKLERIMSEWQNHVECDLSTSGVDAMLLSELVSHDELEELYHTTKLRFVQTNGPYPLRQAICRLYPETDVDNVLVTNGSSEALMMTLWKNCEPGYELVEIAPTYSLVGGLARSLGATVQQVPLVESQNWALDLNALETTITSSTKMIYVCNPNNPTGSILTEMEMEAIVQCADKVGAWILADEIYHGAELSEQRTRSFWGMYDKLLVTSSRSKAYGLAGLRLGWLVGPKDVVTQTWYYHDYTTTTTTALSAALGQLALQPERQARIFTRTHTIAQKNYQRLATWLEQHAHWLTWIPTKIGGLAFFRYSLDIPSGQLAQHFIHSEHVLLAPGEYFGAEQHFRIGYSVPQLSEGLERLSRAFATVYQG
jgi:aspartate/methionine/tyrosine aminotransferase